MPPFPEEKARSFVKLGQILRSVSHALAPPAQSPPDLDHISCRGGPDESLCTGAAEKDLFRAALKASEENPWFSPREISRALTALSGMLRPDPLNSWLNSYPALWDKDRPSLLVGLIMAGNIPLVGFHDILCVLISGHRLLARPSSSDSTLPLALARCLGSIDKELGTRMQLSKQSDERVDAMIATGSDNTARYFLHQYAHLPHIIRKNRNSLTLLTGDESPEELQKLGQDVFAYYGLGCRSVSHLLLPYHASLELLSRSWQGFGYVMQNQAYANNLRHYQALYQVEGAAFERVGPSLLRESRKLASPPSVLHYTLYKDADEAEAFVKEHQNQLQCIVCARGKRWPGLRTLPPGESQQPGPGDYADDIDTMQFLLDL